MNKITVLYCINP